MQLGKEEIITFLRLMDWGAKTRPSCIYYRSTTSGAPVGTAQLLMEVVDG